MLGNCVVCEGRLTAGRTAWHSVCRSCSYEGAALEPCINEARETKVDEDEREIGLRQIRMENFRDLLDHIGRLCQPSQRKLLDVGCAHGWFLETAHQRFEVLGIEPDQPFQVHDLLGGGRYLWHGAHNYVELNPHAIPAHIFRVRHRVRTVHDFEYFM